MEEEKKRKRADDHGGGGESRRRSRKKEAEEVGEDEVTVAAEAAAQPSEEEVEEFYNILRRMRVAYKYFENSGRNNRNISTANIINEVNGDGRRMTELGEDGVDGVKIGGRKDVVVENRRGGLDLNAFPEPEI